MARRHTPLGTQLDFFSELELLPTAAPTDGDANDPPPPSSVPQAKSPPPDQAVNLNADLPGHPEDMNDAAEGLSPQPSAPPAESDPVAVAPDEDLPWYPEEIIDATEELPPQPSAPPAESDPVAVAPDEDLPWYPEDMNDATEELPPQPSAPPAESDPVAVAPDEDLPWYPEDMNDAAEELPPQPSVPQAESEPVAVAPDEDLPGHPEASPELPSPPSAAAPQPPVSAEPPPSEPFDPTEDDIFSAAEDLPEEMPPLAAPLMELAAITQLLDDPLPVARPAPPAPAPIALSPLAEQLAAVAQQCAACTRCGLHKSRTQTVFADGNPQARLMIIGEGPGQNEDETGTPFVGKAGQLLSKMLESVGLNRAQDTYIANIVKCRPPQNRTPTPEEMAACLTHLRAQINLVQPRLIVLAGGTAVKGLLGNIGGITKVRGSWRTWQGIPCMPIFHPSYLLRNESRAVGSPKWETWQDLKAIYARYQALDASP